MHPASKRTKAILIIVVLLLPIAIISAVTSIFDFSPESSEVRELKWLQDANPERDAKEALDKNDFRLRVTSEKEARVPGLNQRNYSKCAEAFGVNPIKHPTDAAKDDALSKLITNAKDYSLIYNRTILAEGPKLDPKLPANCADYTDMH